MNKNEVKEGNILIAEFMGFEIEDKGYGKEITIVPDIGIDVKLYAPLEEALLFNKSWDWLMPVIAKCTEIGYGCEDDNIDYHFDKFMDTVEPFFLNNALENTFEEVVKFVKLIS